MGNNVEWVYDGSFRDKIKYIGVNVVACTYVYSGIRRHPGGSDYL